MSTDESSKKTKKLKRPKWLILLLILALIVAAIFIYQQRALRINQQSLAELETEPYARETLISTITGAGTIRPKQSAVLYWQTSGFVGSADFSAGDEVPKGAILYELDASRLPADILQARLNLLNAQTSLNNLEADTDLQRVTLQNNISGAESSLESLNQNLLALTSRECTSWRLSNLQTAYDDALEAYQNYPSTARWMQVEAARADLAYCDPAKIEQEITALNHQISLQEQNIRGWQTELKKIASGPDPKVRERFQLQIDLAEKQLEGQAITAPFSGTITSLSFSEGDAVSAGREAAQIADLSALFVDVPISEVDIPLIKVGQKADLVFDAFYNQTFQGTVSKVDTVGTNAAGIVNYNVTVQLDSDPTGLKPGMTAGVTIIIEEKPNTYTVPADSIVSRNGQYYVFVLRENKPVQVEVKIGAYSSRKVEILQAEIADGELILVSPPSTLMDFFMRPGRSQ